MAKTEPKSLAEVTPEELCQDIKAVGDYFERARLRKWVTREELAEYVSRHFFPCSPRTIEVWPLTQITVHKRAMVDTNEGIAHAAAMLAEAEKDAVRVGWTITPGAKLGPGRSRKNLAEGAHESAA
jgi:hypothetical protein